MTLLWSIMSLYESLLCSFLCLCLLADTSMVVLLLRPQIVLVVVP